MKKAIPRKWNQETYRNSYFIPQDIQTKTNKIEGNTSNSLKEKIHQEVVKILSIYVSNARVVKFIKEHTTAKISYSP